MSVVPPPRPTPEEEVGPLAPALTALADRGWTVLHQLRWPGRLVAPVDHVLVGPGGVVVLAVPRPAARAASWRPRRKAFEPDAAALALAGAAVASLLHSEHHGAVRSVLCCRDGSADGSSGASPVAVVLPAGIHVLGPGDLLRWTADLPAVLDDDEARRVAAHLRWQLGDPAEHARQTADEQPDGVPPREQPDDVEPAALAVVPMTRRALREAERLAQEQRRWGLSRRRARPARAPAPAGGSPRRP